MSRRPPRTTRTDTLFPDTTPLPILDGRVEAETVSGNITVDSRGERVRRLSSTTVSGNANLQVGIADGGSVTAESVSGNIKVIAPKSLSATVHAESFSGHLRAPGVAIDKPRFGPGSSFEHRYGSGSGEIGMETFSDRKSTRLNSSH